MVPVEPHALIRVLNFPPAARLRAGRRTVRVGFVYVMEAAGLYKVGFSAAPRRRLPAVQVGCPVPITLIGTVEGTALHERAWHMAFAGRRSCGEWFKLATHEVQRILLWGSPDPFLWWPTRDVHIPCSAAERAIFHVRHDSTEDHMTAAWWLRNEWVISPRFDPDLHDDGAWPGEWRPVASTT